MRLADAATSSATAFASPSFIDRARKASRRLYGIAPDEAPKVTEAARRTRERAVRTIAEATAQIERALDEAENALSLSRWAAEPGAKRWKVPLKTMELGQPRTRLDRVFAALEALPGALEAVPLPGEEQPEPEVHFGWSGIGAGQTPPGARAS